MRRQSAVLPVVVFRAILAWVRIIRAFLNFVALQKDSHAVLSIFYVRPDGAAQVKIGAQLKIETKLRGVKWGKGVGRALALG